MILGIWGLPGSGKTTTLTAISQKALARKKFLPELRNDYKYVFTNFYSEGCYKLDFDDLKNCARENSLMIIDEISLYADSRNFKTFDAGLMYFFKMHRHYGIDLIWCSQSASDADKKIRDITDTFYLLEPSWIPHRSTLKKIYHNFSFANRQITDTYDVAPFVQWKHIYLRKYFKYFDSYEKQERPEIKLEVWKHD